jgi:hypothetical protein
LELDLWDISHAPEPELKKKPKLIIASPGWQGFSILLGGRSYDIRCGMGETGQGFNL